ncbi:putative asparagine synthetase [Vairimorpha apis BRL 01]|uniref:Putative asparagine synthetase n=1 Tax=Vairimorpha apis BRL 01 TaxID=1037528 RepID=T0LCH4_9MICR|nr:putative asparagine synthetase [Vairimorpha apis BRL 01]
MNSWVLKFDPVYVWNLCRDYHGLIKYDDLTICSSVLYIRDEIKQPICTDKYIFLYNGEIYNESKSDTLGFLKKQFGISSVKYDYEINSNFLYIYNKIDKNIITFEKVNYFTERFACIGHFTNNYIKQLFNFFSGGIDSIILAMYLHFVSDISRPIYLINTGFNNSQDRINGKLAYKELSLKINQNTKEKIYDLIYPKSNNMDFNIRTVLYFTAKTARSYSKVGFLGSGADELFCGYNKYKSEKPDDRIKNNKFCIKFKRDDLQNEIENKIILRKILRYYNLNNLSNIPKKAMQYGSGIFKLEKCIF